jgi:uncharacterized membrane protein
LKLWKEIKRTLLAGLLVLTPITLTVYILYILFGFLDGLLRDSLMRFVTQHLGFEPISRPIPGLGILFLLALLFLVGIVARNFFGRKLISFGEWIVTRIPLINRIYVAIREISEAFLSEKREVFKKAVLIEYPRKGIYSIAFFTQDTRGHVQEILDEDVVSVFVPTTPNPTSGYLLFVPKNSVQDLDMNVEDALKLVISGGSIHVKKHMESGNSFFKYINKRKKRTIKDLPSTKP